ncbi:hypothetical protein LCGC14_2412780 [marine sediment metagenome]|uniref:Uncharacterized protein n=1 Tax=marine sediment metagenome TaxID=412755 RepID=A0A0F9E461_9ZZZZ
MTEQENVCCIHLGVIRCGESDEHQHIACAESKDGTISIDNEHIKNHCLGISHNGCPFLLIIDNN